MDPAPDWEGKKIRILIADSSRISTQLLSDALERDPGLDVVSWDGNPSSLLSTAQAQNVAVIAISSSLKVRDADAFQLVRELRSASPASKAVILLDSEKHDDVVNSFRAGARGVFSRDSSVDMFCKCVRRVHQGEIWADTRGITLAIDALASTPVVRAVDSEGLNLLSKRELEVVRCLVQGLTNREIAEKMGLSQHTIKNYLFRIFDKLGVSSRTELLFMTLSQNNSPEESLLHEGPRQALQHHDQHQDEATLGFLEKAAEKGIPAAQLALAQIYLTRLAQPEDLVQAYMWYLIATERISRAQVMITRTLSPSQIQEGERKANAWLTRMTESQASAPVVVSQSRDLKQAKDDNRGEQIVATADTKHTTEDQVKELGRT
jgi:DNA-binding NarL/FixJ family response regulator